jgi:hypothetical protein
MTDEIFEEYDGPYLSEFTIRQNGKVVHSVARDEDDTTRFTLRIGILGARVTEWYKKIHIDMAPGNLRANPPKTLDPGPQGQEAIIPAGTSEPFIFEADYEFPIEEYSLESVQFFVAHVYLLSESGKDGSYIPDLLFKTLIRRS